MGQFTVGKVHMYYVGSGTLSRRIPIALIIQCFLNLNITLLKYVISYIALKPFSLYLVVLSFGRSKF